MKFIDIHAHIYPEAIAAKAVAFIGVAYGRMLMHEDGTLASLLRLSEEAGIAAAVVHSAAIKPSNVAHINDFLAASTASAPDRLIGFGTLHPGCEDLDAELDRLQALGLKGVKVHPDCQSFYADSPEALTMFRLIGERGLPVLVHTGDRAKPYSDPERLARAADALPGTRFISAHLGGYTQWQRGTDILSGRGNVWADCSSSLYALEKDEAAALIRRWGADRVLFGTDYPMWTPKDEVGRFLALPLTDAERELIAHANAEKLLGLA